MPRLLLIVPGLAAACAGALVLFAPSSVAAPHGRLCQNVYLVSVRGSGDTSSSMGEIGEAVNKKLAAEASDKHVLAFDHYGLPYTAVGIAVWKPTMPVAYWLSERQGRNMLRAYLRSLTGDCPAAKIGLIGYSQGAQVVGDVLSRNVGGLTGAQLAQIKAVALVADPRFNSQETYDHGSFRRGRNGMLGARTPSDLSSVSGRISAWCRKDDLVCQGPGTTGNHSQSNYLNDYEAQIVSFFADKLGFPVNPSGGSGVVSATGIDGPKGTSPLRFGLSTGADVGRFAGDPDRVFSATQPGSWAGFDGWDVFMISPGSLIDGYRCPGKVGRTPCMTLYAYDRNYKLAGFYTNSTRFHTVAGSMSGTTVDAALAHETGHAPYIGAGVQCPSVILSAPTGVIFKLDVDSKAQPPKVNGITVASGSTSDGC